MLVTRGQRFNQESSMRKFLISPIVMAILIGSMPGLPVPGLPVPRGGKTDSGRV